MKKILMAMLVLGLVSCGNSNTRKEKAQYKEDQKEAKEAVQVKAVEHRYEGTVPAADGPGIVYKLTLVGAQAASEGNFAMMMTYKEAENGQDRSFDSKGKWSTVKGNAANLEAVIYKLVADSGILSGDPMYFMVTGSDNDLTLLDDKMNKIDSELNYTLKRKK